MLMLRFSPRRAAYRRSRAQNAPRQNPSISTPASFRLSCNANESGFGIRHLHHADRHRINATSAALAFPRDIPL